ncbi:MAG: L,D-transpeptidase [Bacteroidales bacterium]|jgi:lipoprotein-anchoring transpeptidase ErfK/SrfK
MTTREYLFEAPGSPAPEPIEPRPPRRSVWKIILFSFLGFLGFVGFIALSLYLLFIVIPQGPEMAMARGMGKDSTFNLKKTTGDLAKVQKDITALEKKIDKLTSQGPYLIVNTTENKFYLYDGKGLIRQGRCSTGKNIRLIDEKRNQVFEFKTPRGVHKVILKQKNPVWAKPNWAFIEEGLPIPPAGDESRFDSSTLGDYKLGIGDGYMVHGTLFQRRIGLPVTHGCVRLLDDDLEVVFNTLSVGSKVIIY